MASLTIQEESSTKEEGDKIWALVTQYYNELVKAQDPTDLAQKIEDHAVSPRTCLSYTRIDITNQKQLGDLRVRCPAEADTYSSIDAVLEKTRSIVDAFSQAKGHPERLSSESTERVEPESTECVAPETAEVQTVDNGDSASRRTQGLSLRFPSFVSTDESTWFPAGNSSNKRKKSASDSDQDKPQKSKRRKASRSPEVRNMLLRQAITDTTNYRYGKLTTTTDAPDVNDSRYSASNKLERVARARHVSRATLNATEVRT